MPEGKRGLTMFTGYSPSNRASQRTRLASRQDRSQGMEKDFGLRDAQAVCCFRCLASKFIPFFQMTKVIAAIFLAKVSRAIVGLIPLASKAS